MATEPKPRGDHDRPLDERSPRSPGNRAAAISTTAEMLDEYHFAVVETRHGVDALEEKRHGSNADG
ncbi:hypothetical protein [Methanopyrus sp.]